MTTTENSIELTTRIINKFAQKHYVFDDVELARDFGPELIAAFIGDPLLLDDLWIIVVSYLDEDFFLKLLINQVLRDQNLRHKLWDGINASRNDAKAAILAANAITLLNAAEIDFNGMNLNNIKIPKANLSGGQFDHAELKNTDLRACSFYGAWLRKANLSNANASNIKFAETAKLDLLDADAEETEVQVCRYTQDLHYLAVAAGSEIYIYYDIFCQSPRHFLLKHNYTISSLAITPKGILAAADTYNYHSLQLWSLKSKHLLHTFQKAELINCLVAGPEETLISGGLDNAVRLWSIEAGKLLHTFKEYAQGKHSINSVAVTQDGIVIAGSDDDCGSGGTVCFWDSRQKQPIYPAKKFVAPINSVAVNAQGLLAIGSGSLIYLWEAKQQQLLHTLAKHENQIMEVNFNAAGQLLASGSADHTVCLWSIPQQRCLNTFEGHTGYVNSVVFGPGVITSGSDDGSVRFWDIHAQRCLRGNSDLQRYRVNSVSFMPQATILASASNDNTVHFWDIEQKCSLPYHLVHQNSVDSVAFNNDGRLLAAVGADSMVRLWDAKKSELLATLIGHDKSVISVAFSLDGRLLASGSTDNKVCLWDVAQKKLLHTFIGHTDAVSCLAFSYDGKFLASGSWDRSVCVWNLQTRKLEHIFPKRFGSINSVAFAASGILAAGGSDFSVQLYRVTEKKLLYVLKTYIKTVTSIAFSANGKLLVTGSSSESYDSDKSGNVCFWDVEQKKCIATIDALPDGVKSVAWVENAPGTFLAVCGANRSVRVFKVLQKNNKFDCILHFASQPNTLNLYQAIMDGVIGLSVSDSKLVLQHQAKGKFTATARAWQQDEVVVVHSAISTSSVSELISASLGSLFAAASSTSTISAQQSAATPNANLAMGNKRQKD